MNKNKLFCVQNIKCEFSNNRFEKLYFFFKILILKYYRGEKKIKKVNV